MSSVLITGVLKDAFGVPIPNYEFLFEAIRTSETVLNTTSVKFTTSALGEYYFTLEYGTYTLKAKAQRDIKYQTIASNILVYSQGLTNKDIQYLLTSQADLVTIDQTLLEALLQVKADILQALTYSVVDMGNVSLADGVYPTPRSNSKGGYFSSLWCVTTGGTVSGTIYDIGDQLLYSNITSTYRKIDNTDLVTSVNGMTGTVVVTTITGNAGTATTLQTARTIGISGDGTGTATSFNGSANITIPFTLATIATAGTYKSVTIDAKGRVTSGTNPTTLAGYGITDAQPLDAELTALAGLTTNGIIIKTAAGATTTRSIAVSGTGLSIANADGITGNPTITSNATNLNTASTIVSRDASGNFSAGTITATLSGNATTATTLQTTRSISITGDGSWTTSFNGGSDVTSTFTLANSGVAAGTYSNITVDVKGRVTAGDNSATITNGSINNTPIGATTVSTGAFSTLSSTGNTTIGGTLTVNGNVIVNGTTTTYNSTTVTIDDPILTLGGDTAPTIDDSKDRGIEFRWHNGTTAKVGFFGFDDSTGYFTFIPDATNTSEVFSGTQGSIAANLIGAVTGNSTTATTLQTTRNIAITGDGTGITTFNGGADASIAFTLATVATAGTYKSVTIDAKGRVTSGTNPTTLAGFGITDAQPLDSDLTALAGLSTTGLIVRTAAGTATTRTIAVLGSGISITDGNGISANPTISINSSSANNPSTLVYRDGSGNFSAGTITAALSGNANTASTLATARSISITGDGTWTTSFNGGSDVTAAFTLASTGVTAGTYPSVTVDVKGRVTSATSTLTINTANFSITDATDATKVAKFLISGNTTGTTRTYTLPNTSSTLVDLDTAQTIAAIKTFSATTQNIGSSTATSTVNLGYGATLSGSTKTINIGTAGVSGSITNVNIGSSTSGSLGVINLNNDVVFTTTGYIALPDGTTAQRPSSPVNGMMRYNTDTASFEGYVNNQWGGVGGANANGAIYENSQVITSDYTLTTGKNGLSAGPITINTGVTVSIPNGSYWVVT